MNMSVVRIIVVALDEAERIIVREAVKHYAESVNLDAEDAKTQEAFKSVVWGIMEKMKND